MTSFSGRIEGSMAKLLVADLAGLAPSTLSFVLKLRFGSVGLQQQLLIFPFANGSV
jgi:hypothetical protein